MSTEGKCDRTRIATELLVPEVVRGLLEACGSIRPDPDTVYRKAVGLITAALLSQYGSPAGHGPPPPGSDAEKRLWARVKEELGEIEPEQVGLIYEHLRGLRLRPGEAHGPVPERDVRERRNQGLFYTPKHIVRHIVSKTLDEFQASNPRDLLDVRILDPAVGGGLFLAEALEQLTQRILDGASECRPHHRIRLAQIRESIVRRMRLPGPDAEPDMLAAVRIHVMTQCLYGVDLDPTAATIARALLMHRAFRGLPVIAGFEPNVREGNSLMGEDGRNGESIEADEANRVHATAYAGHCPSEGHSALSLCESLQMIHWPLVFPEVFRRDKPGFDVVIGNPPYEIVSVKESGILSRGREQAYFRRMYETCSGKINTYRVMLERGLRLLGDGGILGFIVPATLLADSTAEKLRLKLLDDAQFLHAVVIPEKARVFERVTQALLILVIRKGVPTLTVRTACWDGTGPIGQAKGVEVSRDLIRRTFMRIPLLRSVEEKMLLETLLEHPPLGGDNTVGPAAAVHQGEINLTTHRRFISSERTAFPLIRGEHLQPFQVNHPSTREGRLDWVSADFPDQWEARGKLAGNGQPSLFPSPAASAFRPWEHERIGLGRVVNMAAATRLKAAYVAPGQFLGDMTNSLTHLELPVDYLLGLLNSKVLNWRIKLTSTNNYLSAAEIEALPIPR
ncbi:MAG: Eco57I restriction-modification methylase domain-containing protein, partial [Pseudomonadota bacterium]